MKLANVTFVLRIMQTLSFCSFPFTYISYCFWHVIHSSMPGPQVNQGLHSFIEERLDIPKRKDRQGSCNYLSWFKTSEDLKFCASGFLSIVSLKAQFSRGIDLRYFGHTLLLRPTVVWASAIPIIERNGPVVLLDTLAPRILWRGVRGMRWCRSGPIRLVCSLEMR